MSATPDSSRSRDQNSSPRLTTPIAFLLAGGFVAVAVVIAAVVIRSGGSEESVAYKVGYSAGQEAQGSTLSKDLTLNVFCAPGAYNIAVERTATPQEREDYGNGCVDGFNESQPDLNDATDENTESNASAQAMECTSDLLDYAAMIPGWIEAGAQDISPGDLLRKWGGDSPTADIAEDVATQVSSVAASGGDVDTLLNDLRPEVESRCSSAY